MEDEVLEQILSGSPVMAIFRQVVAPFLIVLVFLVALLAVSIRSFLPSDMAAPAPIEEVEQPIPASPDVAGLPPSLNVLVHGLPDDSRFAAPL